MLKKFLFLAIFSAAACSTAPKPTQEELNSAFLAKISQFHILKSIDKIPLSNTYAGLIITNNDAFKGTFIAYAINVDNIKADGTRPNDLARDLSFKEAVSPTKAIYVSWLNFKYKGKNATVEIEGDTLIYSDEEPIMKADKLKMKPYTPGQP